MKRSVLFLIVLLFSVLVLPAVNMGEDAVLLYFPTTVANNRNVLVNLGTAGSLTAESFQVTFRNTSSGNLALFRIRETLTTNPDSSSAESGSIAIQIESLDNWEFVNENNPTERLDFSLDAFYLEQEVKQNGNKYAGYSDPGQGQIGASTVLPLSDSTASFVSSAGQYVLTLPYTNFRKCPPDYYPVYIRVSDICLNIPSLGDASPEPGYYSTRLRITVPAHTQYSTSGSSSVGSEEIEITIRGYLGIDTSGLSASSSFAVVSDADSYSMDLGISQNPASGYAVAKTIFNYSTIVYDDLPSSESETRDKYRIYVSASNDYLDSSAVYRFIKYGSENQARTDENTIYYDLTWQGKENGISYINPTYNSSQMSRVHGGGGRNSWFVTWTLDKTIYLKLTQTSLNTSAEHQQGLYYSYIYFTLVTN